MTYTIEQLANLAREGDVPEFLFERYGKAKLYLLKPMHWVWGVISAALPILAFIALLVTLYVASQIAPALMELPLWQFTGAIAVLSLGILIALDVMFNGKDMEATIRDAQVHHLAADLIAITRWTGYSPRELAALSTDALHKLADRIVIEACREVLKLQSAHAQDDPAAWCREHEKLAHQLNEKYDFLKSYGLVEQGGYGPHFKTAQRELAGS